MIVNGPTLFFIEKILVVFIAENCQAGLLISDLTAEWIDHAHGVVPGGLNHRMIQTASLDEFGDQHAFVNQVDGKVASIKPAVVIINFSWIGDDTFDTLGLKIVQE